MKIFIRIVNSMNEWVGKFVSLWIILLVVIIMFEITMRYVFDKPTIWAHETSIYIFGTMWIICGGYAALKERMVNMDAIYIRFSQRTKAIFDVCTFVFSLIFCVVLIWKSGDTALNSIKFSEMSETAWRVPFWPIRTMLPIGGILLLLQIISKFVKDIYIVRGRN